MNRFIQICVIMLSFHTIILAQQPIDTTTIDGIIKSTYQLLSGPAGERDWKNFRSLFHKSASMGAVVVSPEGKRKFFPFSVDKYIQNNDPFMKQNDFFEEEIGRSVTIFGGVAQVQSAFHYKLSEHGKIEKRGINNIQLVQDNNRWWIYSLVWEDESKDNKIAKELLFE